MVQTRITSCRILVVVSVFALAGRAIAAEPAKAKVTISKETTRITEPLTPDGYPDYLEWFNRKYSAGVTPGNNAVVLLWRVVGPKEVPEKIREEYFRRLGMPVPTDQGEYLADHDQNEQGLNGPWRDKDLPQLAVWLAANDGRLNLAVEASRRQRYFSPQIRRNKDSIFLEINGMSGMRCIVRSLNIRAMHHLGQGRTRNCEDDLLAAHRLGCQIGGGPTFIDGLVANAVRGRALSGLLVLARHSPLSKQDADRIRRRLKEDVRESKRFADRLDEAERFFQLGIVCEIARRGAYEMLSPFQDLAELGIEAPQDFFQTLLLRRLSKSTVDGDRMLKFTNRAYDKAVAAMRVKEPARRQEAVQSFVAEASRTHDMARRSATALLFMPNESAEPLASDYLAALALQLGSTNLSAINCAENRVDTQSRIVELELAISAYRTKHAANPRRLSDLVPEFIESLPRDEFTGADFVYKRTDAAYHLYSLGPNGRDDRGRTLTDQPPGDDVDLR